MKKRLPLILAVLGVPAPAFASIDTLIAPYSPRLAQWLAAAGHDEMSPVGMFTAADWVVKAVMLSLLAASILSWVIFLAKLMILRWEKSQLARRYRLLERAGSLTTAQTDFARGKGVVGQMVRAAIQEVARTGAQPDMKPGIKERVGSDIARIEAGATRRIGRGAGFLANVGSTAPFVGLFGTVWGIMNSFIGIAESNSTNLAVVAPGIAEALLATAIGLVAAIPAVVFYNLLARGISGYKVMLADAGSLVERTLSRDLDLGVYAQPATPVATHSRIVPAQPAAAE